MFKKLLLIITLFVAQASIAQFDDSDLFDYKTMYSQPVFPGGLKEFNKYIGQTFKAPDVEGLSGVIKIDFIIEKNGLISMAKIITDIGSGAGDAAVKAILSSPAWLPGEENGKKVRVVYHNYPITVSN